MTQKLCVKTCLIPALFGLIAACQDIQVSPPIESETTVDIMAFDPDPIWQKFRTDFTLFYAYRDSRGVETDAYLDRLEVLLRQTQDRATFRALLHRATYAFTDPHLSVGPFADTDYNILPTSADLQIGYDGGDYRVLDVRQRSAAYDAGIRPGWQLLSAKTSNLNSLDDGTRTDPAIDDLIADIFIDLIDTPTDAQRAYAATLIANGHRQGSRHLTFETPTQSFLSLTLSNPRAFAETVQAFPVIETHWHKSSDRNIAHLRINNRLGDNALITAFDTALSDIAGADGIIIDLRNTPSGGNSEVGRSIIGHFTSDIQPYQIHERPSLEREFTVPRRFVEQVYPRKPFFDPDKTVVLGGYWTGSMGEGIVIGMDAVGVHTIASDMGDLLGAISNFSFDDGRIRLDIPTESLFHVDGRPRDAFIADMPLPSADSDEDGSDPALSAALTYLQTR